MFIEYGFPRGLGPIVQRKPSEFVMDFVHMSLCRPLGFGPFSERAIRVHLIK